MIDFDAFTKGCLRMRKIWANKLLPKALKSGPIWSHWTSHTLQGRQ